MHRVIETMGTTVANTEFVVAADFALDQHPAVVTTVACRMMFGVFLVLFRGTTLAERIASLAVIEDQFAFRHGIVVIILACTTVDMAVAGRRLGTRRFFGRTIPTLDEQDTVIHKASGEQNARGRDHFRFMIRMICIHLQISVSI